METQKINWLDKQIYLPHPLFMSELKHELTNIAGEIGDLLVAEPNQSSVFALDIWRNPIVVDIESIGDAVKKLKAIQAFWYPHIISHARRVSLIAEQLPQCKLVKPYQFPLKNIPDIGVFSLLDKNKLLYATQRDKQIPGGKFDFIEDKVNPPNRAYLKLWEALSLLNKYPNQNDFAVDLGASPGGWTYVLQSLGARVLAIDKAPLESHIAKLPGVECRQESIFSLKPSSFSQINWLVCDVACYPEKLYEWILPWIASGKVGQFIITLKLQGKTNFDIIRKFQAIPDSKVLHLYHNKHEVTFFYPYV